MSEPINDKAEDVGVSAYPLASLISSIDEELEELLGVSEDESDSAEIESKEEANPRELADQVITEAVSGLREGFRSALSDWLEEYEGEDEAFRRRLEERWGPGNRLLRECVALSASLGAEFNRKEREPLTEPEGFRIEALTRLHARGCQVSNEIAWLLSGGFPTGAMARWRSLYEATIIAMFLRDAEPEVSHRFLLHDVVMSKQAQSAYRKSYVRLGFEPPDPEDERNLEEAYSLLIAKYGKTFGSDYGWAADALKTRRPRFYDIEKDVGFDHWRPYFKLSSQWIHALSKGLLFTLELGKYPEILLTGPSAEGLDEPGQCTAINLWQLTVTLVTISPTLGRLVGLRVLEEIMDETVREFTRDAEKVASESDA